MLRPLDFLTYASILNVLIVLFAFCYSKSNGKFCVQTCLSNQYLNRNSKFKISVGTKAVIALQLTAFSPLFSKIRT